MTLIDHKPRTEEVKLTKKELRAACSKPMIQTKIKLRSKWTAQIKYKVLQVFQLNREDRRAVSKALVEAVTPAKAKRIAFLHHSEGWSYRDISMVKDFDCGVLQFKGLAVALYYKRQCNEVEPVATDPIPIGALENDDDIWARLDLFSKSPRELHASVREELIELTMENTELKHKLMLRDMQIADLERKSNNSNPRRK